MPDGMPTTEKRLDRIERSLEWAIGWNPDDPIRSAKAFGSQHSRIIAALDKLDRIERALFSLGLKVVICGGGLIVLLFITVVLLSRLVAEYQTGIKVGSSVLGGGS